MTEVAQRYGRIADAFTGRLTAVPPGTWTSASPCEGWTAHDVAKHVVDTHRRILTRLSGGDPTPPDTDEDLAAAWSVESEAVRAALADPARAATEVQGMGGSQPFEELVSGVLCADTLLHTWDLARATGQDERLDPGAAEAAYAFLQPNDEMLRVPGGFGPKVDPPDGADVQTQLLCFTGRSPLR
ncbi:MAG: TIGR03086 family protein [Actinobacteria bacterium]|nr:TIGR03086 family protein [Actinomycetota bacterium]MCA1721286.1 TIGR03086 family protein [Actinomycetota bacterium]